MTLLRGIRGRPPGLPRRGGTALLVTLALLPSLAHADPPARFEGWVGMRVIALEKKLPGLIATDLDQDGRDELVLTNTSKGRLEILRWVPRSDRKVNPDRMDPDDPNVMPMATEFEREEIALDDLPRQILARDLDGDGRQEFLILLANRRRLLIYEHQDDGWKEKVRHDLVSGTYGSSKHLMRLEGSPTDGWELFVSFSDGIQRLELKPGAKARWHTPRDYRDRADWWFADLDGDGDRDLLEWSPRGTTGLRWHERHGDLFLPARPVTDDRTPTSVTPYLRSGSGAELLMLGAGRQGALLRYRMGRGDESPIGQQRLLPVAAGLKGLWCSLDIDGSPALVYPDPKQPRVLLHRLEDSGWDAGTSFPTVSDVKAVAAPVKPAGTLLLWAKDASDLHICRWEGGRLTYPRPMPQSEEAEGRTILGMDTVGQTVWWVQKVGRDLSLYTWGPADDAPQERRFADVGSDKADRVQWLGGDRLLVLDKFSRKPKLVVAGTPKSVVRQEGHLGKMKLEELVLIPMGEEFRPAKLADGVLQWLDQDLHPVDQVMLPDGKRLGRFVPLGEGRAWALEQGAEYLHLMAPDDAGILRVSDTHELPGGGSLRHDSRLGLVLEADSQITALSPGKPLKLELVQSIDSREGRPAGVRNPRIHRVVTTELTGNGSQEVVLFDDRRRQATALELRDDRLEPILSWQVWEDKTYPYGGESGQDPISEPRIIVGCDVDGDDGQDLALLCHNRVVIYLSKEEDR